jgi:7,8-didemethyl-8-hydroxy-5-deazariboflavin synthase CofH subunit
MRSDAATPLHLAATAEAALGRIDPAVARILDRSLSGEAISTDDALALWQTTGPELQALCQAADELRRRAVGDAITYVVNRNINWTNICFTDCSFCAFGVSARDPSAYFHPPERVTEKALEAWARGATEVCMQGGLAAQLTPERYLEYLRAVKDPLPEMHVHAFSPAEIDWAMRKWDGSLEEYLTMLRQAGLDTIPGTAAEILVDEVRREIAPKKLMTARWREIITTAHRVGLRSTATYMYGHVEEPRHLVAHLDVLREIQRETGGFTEFVPLGFIHYNTRLYNEGDGRPGPGFTEDLRAHAIPRLFFAGEIDNLQVSWVKLGEKMSQLLMWCGANDFSGTLMEESISRMAGATAGEYLAPPRIRELVWEIGRVPVERSTTYRHLRTYPTPGVHEPATDIAPHPALVPAAS